jgi:malonyl-CoA O-methyltransferase
VRRSFSQQAGAYDRHARLQRALAWRLAHIVRKLPLPPGPAADLGAGTGLVGRSLVVQGWLQRMIQIDLCPDLLGHNPLAANQPSYLWDLNNGLPPELSAGASLLVSSFALQWLRDPLHQLGVWCEALAPQGWLALAVPTDGSFPEWRAAASSARARCTGLPLPSAGAIEASCHERLQLERAERLRFSQPCPDGRSFLRELKAIGANSSPIAALGAGELRRLLQHWPSTGVVTWDVMLLIGQRAP